MTNHPAPDGTNRFRLGKFEYVFRGDSVTLTLQKDQTAFIRGKAFSEIKVHFILKEGKWVYENQPWLIKRKELMHDVSPAQLAEIYATVSADWEKYWNDQTLIQMLFKKYRRASEVFALLEERNVAQQSIADALARLESINAKLDTYL